MQPSFRFCIDHFALSRESMTMGKLRVSDALVLRWYILDAMIRAEPNLTCLFLLLPSTLLAILA